jgi:hypothetical protein
MFLDITLNPTRAPKGRGGCRAATPPKPPKTEIKKNTDFVDIMISKASRDLPFSLNQLLKSADGYYIRILKNNFKNLRNKTIGHCD